MIQVVKVYSTNHWYTVIVTIFNIYIKYLVEASFCGMTNPSQIILDRDEYHVIPEQTILQWSKPFFSSIDCSG